MHIHVAPKPKADLLVLGIFDDKKLDHDGASADAQLKGLITSLLKEEFKPDFKQTKFMHVGGAVKNILLVGLGKRTEFDIDKLRKVSAIAAKVARANRIKSAATTLHRLDAKGNYKDKGRAIAEGSILGLYRFNKYKTVNDDFKVEELALIEGDKKRIEELGHGVHTGSVLANATNYVRDIVNSPACFVTPTALADEAKAVAKKYRLKIKVFNKAQMQKLGMNALLGVASGSSQEPRFIIMEYKSKKANVTIAVVGKGITFDSGGLDLKPPPYMETMKLDKAGAAAVLGIMQTVAHLKLPVNVIGAMPTTENMPGPGAQKPGDVVTAYNKKTIEIMNTDAEGRLILADAISYVEKNYKPRAIIDLATLTGAVVIALGYHAAGILGNDEGLIKKVKDAGWRSFERVWQLPLWQEHKEAAKSDIADVANAFRSGSVDAGTINGAAFISYFVNVPWVHVDIAGAAWSPEEREYIPRAATGYGVRLITQLLMDWKSQK